MTNLFNIGKRGLTAAQVGLNTTGHNITNVNTPGFSRQQALVSVTNAHGSSIGYQGTGVQVDTVRRIYDSFLTNQLNQATAKQASTATYADQMTRVSNLLADNTVGVAPALARFFEGLNAVASQPAEAAAREELLGRAESLVSQLTGTQQYLQDQFDNINQQVQTTVDAINSLALRINELNDQIVVARGTVFGQPPNDLLDQRDQLITDLNELVGVTVVQQGDRFNITIGNGQTLISGENVYPLAAVRSSADPTRLVVAYTTASDQQVELREDVIRGGSLGGLMEYRTEVLDTTQNQLGRLTLGLAISMNELHREGAGLDGVAGRDFFSLRPADRPAPLALSNANNSSQATLGYEVTDINQLRDSDYRVSYTAQGYRVERVSDGKAFVPQDPEVLDGFQLDGITFGAPSQPLSPGDSFLAQPVRYAARDIGVAISAPSEVAASAYDPADPSVGGSANGDVALKMAQLQTKRVLGDSSMSVTEAFSQLVNHVGVKGQAANTALKAQTTLREQAFQAQQAVSGVNLNEEYINLDFYVQQYNASARLIDVGNTLFDTLLGLGR